MTSSVSQKKNDDREKVMEEVDRIRSKTIYQHPPDDCSEICKACGRVTVHELQGV